MDYRRFGKVNTLQEFKHYQLSETADGRSIEIARSEEEVVCLAFDTGRQFFVSMHVLAEDFEERHDEEVAFHQRANEAQQIRHPNVSVVYEVGEDEGTPYFVTEFVDGEPLGAYLARTAPLAEGVGLWLAKQVAEGVRALARFPNLLERCDPAECRVTAYSGYLSGLIVKISDPGVAGKSRAREEGDLCAQLARIVLSATGTGELEQTDAENLKELLGTSSLGGTSRRMITAVADGEIETLEALIRGIERCMDDGGHEIAAGIDSASMPLEQLGAQLRSAASIERALGVDFELDFNDPNGSAISGWNVSRPSDGKRYRVFQLPPARLCEVNLQERIKLASDRRRDRFLKPVVACWPDPTGSLYAEGDGHFESVADYYQRRSGLTGDELIWIASQVHSALDEANDAGVEIWGFGPRGIYVSNHEDGGIMVNGAVSLTIRGHPNLEALTEPCRFSVSGIAPEKALTSPDDYDSFIELVRALPLSAGNALIDSALSRFFSSIEENHAPGTSVSSRRVKFIELLEKFLFENGLLEKTRLELYSDAGDGKADLDTAPGVAQALFGGEEEPSIDAWNPIAQSVASDSDDTHQPEVFSATTHGVSWGRIMLGLLVLLGLLLGALAYFFGWI